MAKVLKLSDQNKVHYGYYFHCPGCKCGHSFWTEKPNEAGARWSFNGDVEKPTFRASLLVTWPGGKRRCHLFVTDGKIQFLGDCTHELAGQTVEMQNED